MGDESNALELSLSILRPTTVNTTSDEFRRTYRIQRGLRRLAIGIGGMFALLSLTVGLRLIMADKRTAESWPIFVLLAPALGVALSAYIVTNALRNRIILTRDSITLPGTFFRAQNLQRDQIAGKRILYSAHGVQNIVLIPNRPDLKRLRIEAGYDVDEVYRTWMNGIPTLDKKST